MNNIYIYMAAPSFMAWMIPPTSQVRLIDSKHSHDPPSAEEVDEIVAKLEHEREHRDTPPAHPSKATATAAPGR